MKKNFKVNLRHLTEKDVDLLFEAVFAYRLELSDSFDNHVKLGLAFDCVNKDYCDNVQSEINHCNSLCDKLLHAREVIFFQKCRV